MKKCVDHKSMRALHNCRILALLLLVTMFTIPQQLHATVSIPDVNDTVLTMVLQSDGKILIGGNFTEVNGATRTGIARLNGADGNLDNSFNPAVEYNVEDSLSPATIYAIAIQPDGKILIGGQFTSVNGEGGNGIVRLNTDGSVDASFDSPSMYFQGDYFDAFIHAITLQPDGKILIGGRFDQISTETRNSIARLNDDGSLDTSFQDASIVSGVTAITLQTDGKVLIGGDFTQVHGVTRTGIARLNGADGSLDASFNPTLSFSEYFESFGFSPDVAVITLQTDGKVLIGGSFMYVNDYFNSGIARLNTDGSPDNSFSGDLWLEYGFDSFPGHAKTIKIQTDGKIVVGGGFNEVYGVSQEDISRLETDGSPDTNFTIGTGANHIVDALALQTDGKLLVGGHFDLFDDEANNHITRLNADGTLDSSFGGKLNIFLRDTAAEWLGRYVHGASHTPPFYTGVYTDVLNGDYNDGWIQQLSDDAITEGCDDGAIYCPKSPVTKTQAVKLILRAKHGGSHSPPMAGSQLFGDVPLNHADADWIYQAKTEGITTGCGDGGNFCPGEVLTKKGFLEMLDGAF